MVNHVDHDVVIVNDQHEVVPPLTRTPEQQQRIDQAQEAQDEREGTDEKARI
jgi:hypothetical protein